MMRRLLLCLPALAACARVAPLPEHLRAPSPNELRERMAAVRVSGEAYTAELRLTSFGPEGRVRGTASLAVQRPASFRYELFGPHGGVIQAFATNGHELQLLDLGASKFFYGPATPHNISRLLTLVPLDLTALDWVHVLFGEVAVPSDARLSYDEEAKGFAWEWEKSPQRGRVDVDPYSARATRAVLWDHETKLWEIRVAARDSRGLPSELMLEAPAAKTRVEVHLRDVDHAPKLDASLFVLDPPAAVSVERLAD
ncbi:MAG: hypothetical protein HYZ27_07945 [Deltaproteobacteria bacterium]|nr:hypothetical protein [Deltaproteobacteria bacterium]